MSTYWVEACMHAKTNTQASLVYSKETGIEVNTEKTTYTMFKTRGQRAGKVTS
jgi:hypothetical protein